MQASFWKTVAVVGVIGIGSLALLEAQQRLSAHRATIAENSATDSADIVPTTGGRTVDATLSDAEFDQLMNGEPLGNDLQFDLKEPPVASTKTAAAGFDVNAEQAMEIFHSEPLPPQDFTPPPNTGVQLAALSSDGNPFQEPGVSSAAYQTSAPKTVATVGFEEPAAESLPEPNFQTFEPEPQSKESQPIAVKPTQLSATPRPAANPYAFFPADTTAAEANTSDVATRETQTFDVASPKTTAQFYEDEEKQTITPRTFESEVPVFDAEPAQPATAPPELPDFSTPFPETHDHQPSNDKVPPPRELPTRPIVEPMPMTVPAARPLQPAPLDAATTFESGPLLPFAEDNNTPLEFDRVPEIKQPSGLSIPGFSEEFPSTRQPDNPMIPRSDFSPQPAPDNRRFENYNTPGDAPVPQYNEPGIPLGDGVREFGADNSFKEDPRPTPGEFRDDITQPAIDHRFDDRGLPGTRREEPLNIPGNFDSRPDDLPPMEIRSNGSGPNPSVRQVSGTMRPNLVLEKSAPKNASVGVPLNYQIFVRNEGDATAFDVVVEDEVTAATEVEGAHPQSDYDKVARKLIWTFKEILPGQTETITVQVKPTGEGVLDGTASVKFKSRVKATTVVTAPKLRLQMDGPDKVQLGQEVAYRYILTNEGSGEARDVFIRTLLPASGGLKHTQGRDLEYEIQVMKPGEQREIMLAVVAGEPGDHSAKAEVTASGVVAATAGWRTEVIGAQLEIVRRGPKRRFVNREATYENIISNGTSFEARDAKVVEQIPSGMRFINADSGGVYDEVAHTVTWAINRLGAGQSEQLQLQLMPTQAGNMESVVTILENVGIQSDDYVSTTVVEDLHNVSATISQLDGPVAVGDEFGFTITIDNRGTAEARDVNLRVKVPEEIEVRSAGSKSIQAALDPQVPNTVQYSMILRIEPGQKQTFELKLRGRNQVNNGMVEATVQHEHMNGPLVVSESVTVYDERL